MQLIEEERAHATGTANRQLPRDSPKVASYTVPAPDFHRNKEMAQKNVHGPHIPRGVMVMLVTKMNFLPMV